MQLLLTITAVVEAATGAALLTVPALLVSLLFGGTLDTTGLAVGRVAGAALVALGVACWVASYDVRNRAARGLVSAMSLYNLGVALILGAAGLQSRPVGIALWPAVVLHAVMGTWSVASLRRKPSM